MRITSKRVRRLLAALWLLGCVIYVMAGVPQAVFHGDEATVLYTARDYYYQFIEGDPGKLAFREPPLNAAEQDLRLYNGTISNRLYGFVAFHSGYQLEDLPEQWDWFADYDYNNTTGRVPNADLLNRTRFASAIAYSLAIVGLFILAHRFGGWLPAYIASLYFTFHAVLLLQTRRATQEGMFILLSVLVPLVASYYLQKPSWWKLLLFGVICGVALAAKHSAMFLIASIFAVVAILPLRRHKWIKSYRHLRRMVRTGILTLLVFFFLTPQWWSGNPLQLAIDGFEARQELLENQADQFGGYGNIGEQFVGFWQNIFIAQPQFYEVASWSEYPAIQTQIEQYQATPWAGWAIGGSVVGSLMLLGLVIVGIVPRLRQRRMKEDAWLWLSWLVVAMLVAAWLTPLNWQRYYLPAYLPLGLWVSVGLATLISYVHQRVFRRK